MPDSVTWIEPKAATLWYIRHAWFRQWLRLTLIVDCLLVFASAYVIHTLDGHELAVALWACFLCSFMTPAIAGYEALQFMVEGRKHVVDTRHDPRSGRIRSADLKLPFTIYDHPALPGFRCVHISGSCLEPVANLCFDAEQVNEAEIRQILGQARV